MVSCDELTEYFCVTTYNNCQSTLSIVACQQFNELTYTVQSYLFTLVIGKSYHQDMRQPFPSCILQDHTHIVFSSRFEHWH